MQYYCSHCKKTEGVFIKNNKNANGKQYYRCRECNTSRVKKYRETKLGRLAINRAVYKSISKHSQKQKARVILNTQVKLGKIKKPSHCNCGNQKVEGHHEDYSKPLSVIWLCRSCHADLHRNETLNS